MRDVKSKIAVVILAAGEAKRFGSAKQLADWFGEPLLLAQIRKVELCGYSPYLALGAHLDLIVQHSSLKAYKDHVIVVRNWAAGLSASISTSLNYLAEQELKGVVFLLADQPMIAVSYLKRLISEAETRPNELICTAYDTQGQARGVPAYFPAAYFGQLKALSKEQGAKKILLAENPMVLQHDTLLIDIDEPGDLVRATAIQKRLDLEYANNSG